jgi:hypothetical protein
VCEIHKPEKRYDLYDDGKIQIRENPRDYEGHIVTIGQESYIFPSRVLADLYKRSSAGSLVESLNAMNSDIYPALQETDISPEQFGWALAKARVKELEKEARDLRSQIRSLEDRAR